MNERFDPFANLGSLPSFTTKPKAAKPVEEATISKLAEQNNFPSRQVPKTKTERRKTRVYRTGRNQQFNVKLTAETVAKIYKLADEMAVPLGELIKLAVDELQHKESGSTVGKRDT